MTRIIDDSDQLAWLHNDERLELRGACLSVLLSAFGGELNEDGTPTHGNRELYSAAHDYISHGNTEPGGVIKFYLENRSAYVL
ncbi:hypothetical protein [Synechococcus phage S-H34]|uniref:Uncharacterized protein n=1 Tax=Synechococcus phage S-H34 TaxID=2718942 RepID=A0A6G8R6H3_9CAUD|nr:hypothetical protein PQC15_gp115 [Synechococcus phage S-H34]QIN96986.1 hypothetical protein [Synechococcus phage S-H34]